MSDNKQSNPLYGLKMDQLLTEISDHYGWELLSEALRIDRFQFHTGMKSTVKFLRNHEWAKDKVENFYLYQFKNYPTPDDKQLAIAPRNRFISGEKGGVEPTPITHDVIEEIDRAAKLRIYKDMTKAKDEPAYDPSNPWNVK